MWRRRIPFSYQDLVEDCDIQTECYQLDGKRLGAIIKVPAELYRQYPYNASVYVIMQQLRREVFDLGMIEFPNLPLNKTNHTVAIRSPQEHAYSDNPFLTNTCQQPHQDTPPYPTAFGLEQPRRYFATWIISSNGLEAYRQLSLARPELTVEELHQILVPESLDTQMGLLVNHTPGLLLFDNSDYCSLYHAKTCKFDAISQEPEYTCDSPMYSFNEVGLINYMDIIDSRRGIHDRDLQDLEDVKVFMDEENLLG